MLGWLSPSLPFSLTSIPFQWSNVGETPCTSLLTIHLWCVHPHSCSYLWHTKRTAVSGRISAPLQTHTPSCLSGLFPWTGIAHTPGYSSTSLSPSDTYEIICPLWAHVIGYSYFIYFYTDRKNMRFSNINEDADHCSDSLDRLTCFHYLPH